ncbi:MAG: thiamine pyrophosphate-dependent enzyme, partial [Alphaproteobacteria bacterium]
MKKKYPVFNPDYKKSKKVNPYYFMHELSHALKENQVIVSADGTACVSAFQEIKIKKGQRLYTNSGCASMGYELPASIGAWQHDKKEIICIAGDGSIMMNIQELTTIAKNNMNIKIFILNNDGYHSIRQTQNNFFNRQVGCGPDSNLFFPEFSKISNSHDIEYFAIKQSKETKKIINKVLKKNNAVICEVFIDKNQEFAPKVSS